MNDPITFILTLSLLQFPAWKGKIYSLKIRKKEEHKQDVCISNTENAHWLAKVAEKLEREESEIMRNSLNET